VRFVILCLGTTKGLDHMVQSTETYGCCARKVVGCGAGGEERGRAVVVVVGG
jgi:hypothetical protein